MVEFDNVYKLAVISSKYYSPRFLRWDYALRIKIDECLQLSKSYSTLAIL